MDQAQPFRIGPRGISIERPADHWRSRFDAIPALTFQDAFEPALLSQLVASAAKAAFAEDPVAGVGHRAIEQPQRIGKAMSLLFHAPSLLSWLEQATGAAPLVAVAGRLAEMRPNCFDQLGWHDDRHDRSRRLAIIVDLSEQAYDGGQFQLRRKGDERPLLAFDHPGPGSILIFAVSPDLEHRVLAVNEGGPRRVYAGWFLSEPEYDTGTLSKL